MIVFPRPISSARIPPRHLVEAFGKSSEISPAHQAALSSASRARTDELRRLTRIRVVIETVARRGGAREEVLLPERMHRKALSGLLLARLHRGHPSERLFLI